MTGVSTGERCQPTRGVINPHRSAGRHLFRFSYYSFYKTARTKRHRSYSTAENKPELEVKGLKKGRQSTHTSKSGVSIINNMVQTEWTDTKTDFSTKKLQQTWRFGQTGSFWCELDSKRHKTESCWTLDENFFSTLCIFTNNISPLLKIKII